MKKKINIAIIGATGAVGNEIIQIFEERQFPIKTLKLFASKRSIGKFLKFKDKKLKVNTIDNTSFLNVDISIFSAGTNISKNFVPLAIESGSIVIDNTNAFRMDPDIPLIIPEVNGKNLLSFLKEKKRNIISSPNCSTIQMIVALYPIYTAVGINRIVVTTFQSVSGTGKKAINELTFQTKNLLNNKRIKPFIYPHQIAFNCLPHIDEFNKNGYTLEEMKMINETKKIMNDSSIKITATTVRVPVFRSHSESINIETIEKITVSEIKKLLSQSSSIVIQDNPQNYEYPLAINCVGLDKVFVGRIREDKSIKNGINLWVVADNLRKGSALNTVQIAEILMGYLK